MANFLYEARKPAQGHQVAIYSILGFWLFYAVLTTLRSAVAGSFEPEYPPQDELAIRRAVVTALGILVTVGLYFFLRMFENRPLSTRIIAAFLGAIPCAFIISGFNFYIFNIYDPASLFNNPEMREQLKAGNAAFLILEVAISRYFFIACWATLYLAMSFASEVRIAERRASRFAQAAQQAELRSLRYQVNPHFLFNTLNSLSTLVLREKPDEAEAMIMNLSNFYRNSLSGDPLEDVTLEEEVELQRLYLKIEEVRFPKRLRISIDIPEAVADACVPGLILQPLVENAIKYGVSRATRPVTISITAEERQGYLFITVADDGDVIPDDSDKGSGIGLANVRDRLDTRFGVEGHLRTEQPEAGGYKVTVSMPLIHQCPC
ncbi:histidine kinase [Sphingorhabdus sp. Alg239-R122]|uniref:sensor histidine kinase n=1 Tax=Sphingorhabdus sp. Alg239-R122 TaxID=2305989 RepID=UPI0013D91F10|nr:histidine kinase [Sphingorhabdus sp. Alg239-R122]